MTVTSSRIYTLIQIFTLQNEYTVSAKNGITIRKPHNCAKEENSISPLLKLQHHSIRRVDSSSC
jgi:hypothetical protein